MDGVLAVKEEYMFLDNDPFDFVAPNRQLVFEPELREKMTGARFARLTALLAANLDQTSVRQPDEFRQMIQHHRPAKRFRQRRDEQPMIPPRHTARNRSRRV